MYDEGHTDVVKAPRGQPLREVAGKKKTGEEGEEEVVRVTGQSVALAAASSTTQKNLHTNTADFRSTSIKHNHCYSICDLVKTQSKEIQQNSV